MNRPRPFATRRATVVTTVSWATLTFVPLPFGGIPLLHSALLACAVPVALALGALVPVTAGAPSAPRGSR
ncbi:hypothetical protein [Kineococcus aurantiacus]|uniref:Uncharacterized protein n=1 Tax=Kineococcus aurantiacus TaxID=37633 RepID=A0A7Y9DM13_9ACTN|nr:hypothetical protein [Kineococcus aurantiacus]NYD22996.1 hypothetical protein [Kineococcus aurantiacus]